MRLYYKFRSFAINHPTLYFAYHRIFNNHLKDIVVSQNTDIVIDGFGGSGNTFAVHVFNLTQNNKYKISHHSHVPATIIKAARLNIPIIVLIREPLDAILSFFSRGHREFNDFTVKYFLNDYINYYETINPYRNNFVSVSFDEMIKDYKIIIERINDKFDMTYSTSFNYKEIQNKAFDKITLGKPETTRLFNKKDIKKTILSSNHSKELKKAEEVYYRFLNIEN